MKEDIVIPLFKHRWSTRAVLEALSHHYAPRRIYILCPKSELLKLEALRTEHRLDSVSIHAEETAFEAAFGLSKEAICQLLQAEQSLYNPGWFYQQILKLGAPECLPDLSENYLVWDSDLLAVDAWPVVVERDNAAVWPYRFALLQDNSRGNAKIIASWERWIREILEVEPVRDPNASFVPHHMWFNTTALAEIKSRIKRHYGSGEAWPCLMMRSANDFGTFSEFWLYSSWLDHHHPEKLRYHPYESYGRSTERFFDDGTGKFSRSMRAFFNDSEILEPSYEQIFKFICASYGNDSLPSSLSFESSPRHLKKGKDNMHVEELRSRWHSFVEA